MQQQPGLQRKLLTLPQQQLTAELARERQHQQVLIAPARKKGVAVMRRAAVMRRGRVGHEAGGQEMPSWHGLQRVLGCGALQGWQASGGGQQLQVPALTKGPGCSGNSSRSTALQLAAVAPVVRWQQQRQQVQVLACEAGNKPCTAASWSSSSGRQPRALLQLSMPATGQVCVQRRRRPRGWLQLQLQRQRWLQGRQVLLLQLANTRSRPSSYSSSNCRCSRGSVMMMPWVTMLVGHWLMTVTKIGGMMQMRLLLLLVVSGIRRRSVGRLRAACLLLLLLATRTQSTCWTCTSTAGWCGLVWKTGWRSARSRWVGGMGKGAIGVWMGGL